MTLTPPKLTSSERPRHRHSWDTGVGATDFSASLPVLAQQMRELEVLIEKFW